MTPYRLHCHSIVGCESPPPVDCLLGDWGGCFWSERATHFTNFGDEWLQSEAKWSQQNLKGVIFGENSDFNRSIIKGTAAICVRQGTKFY